MNFSMTSSHGWWMGSFMPMGLPHYLPQPQTMGGAAHWPTDLSDRKLTGQFPMEEWCITMLMEAHVVPQGVPSPKPGCFPSENEKMITQPNLIQPKQNQCFWKMWGPNAPCFWELPSITLGPLGKHTKRCGEPMVSLGKWPTKRWTSMAKLL